MILGPPWKKDTPFVPEEPAAVVGLAAFGSAV